MVQMGAWENRQFALWYLALVALLASSGLFTGDVSAEERVRPVKIGVLTASWGTPASVVGLRDGLLELGYRENEEEAQATLAQVRKGEVDGILQPLGASLNISGFILEAASQQAIPTMFGGAAFWVERGALASYGPDFHETGRQAARLVDKILKGANPAEIPVEVNPKVEFAINLKVAKALGLTIAPEVLYRADRIVR
jgi:hypothetical protein